MKRIRVQSVILFLVTMLWIGSDLLLSTFPFSIPSSAYAFSIIHLSTPTPVPTPSPDARLGFNGTLLTAVAAIVAAILGALITVLFGFFSISYHARKTKELER